MTGTGASGIVGVDVGCPDFRWRLANNGALRRAQAHGNFRLEEVNA